MSYKGPVDCFLRVHKEQGILAFWRGNVAGVLRYFPSHSINFAFKDRYKTILSSFFGLDRNKEVIDLFVIFILFYFFLFYFHLFYASYFILSPILLSILISLFISFLPLFSVKFPFLFSYLFLLSLKFVFLSVKFTFF